MALTITFSTLSALAVTAALGLSFIDTGEGSALDRLAFACIIAFQVLAGASIIFMALGL